MKKINRKINKLIKITIKLSIKNKIKFSNQNIIINRNKNNNCIHNRIKICHLTNQINNIIKFNNSTSLIISCLKNSTTI